MRVVETELPGVLLIDLTVFTDDRGYFLESYNERDLAALGIRERFVQDNHSFSTRNVVRGLHYQLPRMGKLIRAVSGEIHDITVDVRAGSPTRGRWQCVTLSNPGTLLWVPGGFAHGFSVASADAHVGYKTTDFWNRDLERTILWDDPDLRIDWKLAGPAILSPKDLQGRRFRDADPM